MRLSLHLIYRGLSEATIQCEGPVPNQFSTLVWTNVAIGAKIIPL